jgi:peptide/nickel transport system ATP-binding protein
MSQPILEIRNLTIDFEKQGVRSTPIEAMSLSVNRGEIMAIVGESGSGKTLTALSILRLLPQPLASFRSGEIFFAPDQKSPIDLIKLSEAEMSRVRGNQIAMIFQEPLSSLNPVLSCGHQVREAIELHKKLSKSQARSQTLELFEKVHLPDPSAIYKRFPFQLSGGQRQRVMIAMAMSCKPKLLVCDEPTTALDVTVQQTILQTLKDLQRLEQLSVIFITHDLGVVAEIADRAVVLYKGKMVEQGTLKDLFSHPSHPYTKGLLNCRPVLHKKGERLPLVSDFMKVDELGQISESIQIKGSVEKEGPIASLDKNRKSTFVKSSLLSEQEPNQKGVLLKVEHLSLWFESGKNALGRPRSVVKAVNNVSFEVFKGETLGLVGESGSGKTTLGRCLLRLVEPSQGKIFLNGDDLLALKGSRLKDMRRFMQIVFQDPYSSLNPRIKVGYTIEEPLQVHQGHLKRQTKTEKAIQLLRRVDLNPSFRDHYPHELSGGQRQRVVIARALAVDPSFVVFDESVSALDVSVQAQILNLIGDLKREFGFTVIFISHDLSVIRLVSDRIMVMKKGEMVEIGPAEDIYLRPTHEYTRQLIQSVPKGIL